MPGHTEKDEIHLYLSVQARTGIVWGLQEKIQGCIKDLGLSTFDHRQWKPRGMDAEVVSEVYVKDDNVMIKSPRYKHTDAEKDSEESMIRKRCEEIKSALAIAIGQPTAQIKVSQWRPFALDLPMDLRQSEAFWDMPEEQIIGILSQQAAESLKKKEEIETKLDVRPRRIRYKSLSGPQGNIFHIDMDKELGSAGISKETRKHRVRQTTVPNLAAPGLWEHDDRAQQMAMASVAIKPTQTYSMDSNVGPRIYRRKKQKSQMNLPSVSENMPVVEDFLTGLVRKDLSNEAEKKHE